MAANYLVCLGGTGARCLEAVAFLVATGVFDSVVSEDRPLYLLMMDSDQNNGNGRRARDLIYDYHRLRCQAQPQDPERLFWRRRKRIENDLTIFRAPVHRAEETDASQLRPVFWQNPHLAGRKFADAIQFIEQEQKFQHFLRLFFSPDDLEIELDKGFLGRPNIGSVGLKLYLEETSNYGVLRDFTADVRNTLLSDEARVFVVGSVFGGLGAAGVPTFPLFLGNLGAEMIGDHANDLRFGCAMMCPYFSFPKPTGLVKEDRGFAPDSDKHMAATQAALLHYAHVPPGYHHVYLIGAPELFQTAETNVPSGENQSNTAHYAELIAALAILDFFSLKEIKTTHQLMHFADDAVTEASEIRNQGLRWKTLPYHPYGNLDRRRQVKRALVSFATFAYFYKNYLHDAIVRRNEHMGWAWSKDNFLQGEYLDPAVLEKLNQFATSFLCWLQRVGASRGGQKYRNGRDLEMFRWESLALTRPESDACLGHLVSCFKAPRYAGEGYHQIMKRLNALRLFQKTGSPAGRLIYLAHRAAMEFCDDNYSFDD